MSFAQGAGFLQNILAARPWTVLPLVIPLILLLIRGCLGGLFWAAKFVFRFSPTPSGRWLKYSGQQGEVALLDVWKRRLASEVVGVRGRLGFVTYSFLCYRSASVSRKYVTGLLLHARCWLDISHPCTHSV